MDQSAILPQATTLVHATHTVSLPLLEGVATELPAVLRYPLRMSEIATGELHSTLAGQYTVGWVRGADPAGEFAQKVKPLLGLSDASLLSALRGAGYDGFLFAHHDKVFAHAFFQARGGDWHLFSVSVAAELRGFGIGGDVVGAVISRAQDDSSVERVKIGNGGHHFAVKVCESLSASKNQFGVRMGADGWVSFDRRGGERRAA